MVAAAVQKKRVADNTLPKGFKQTEIGLIPEDWKVVALGTTLAELPRYGVNLAGVARNASLPTYLRITDFDDDGVLDEHGLVSVDCQPEDSNSLKNGDLVVARTGASTGRTFRKTLSTQNFVFAGFLIRLRADPEKINSGYLEAVTRTANYRKWIKENSQRSGQPGVNGRQLYTLPIPLPPLPEQEAIAGALSDADGAVRAVERLIEKKRAVKQAALHALLTPTIRLPGFDAEWETKSLGHVCREITDGTHYTPQYVEAGIPFYSVENVTANNFEDVKYITKLEHERLIQRCKPERGDVLLTRIGSIGDAKLIDWAVNASIYVSLALLKFKPILDGAFFAQYANLHSFKRSLEDRSLLNAAPKKINMNEIGQVLVPVPKPDEQRAIAAILSDMDAEIAALEARRDKLKAVKQGMMQSLLTGKVRLV